MKTLFDQATFQEVSDRIDSLRQNSVRQWGEMSPAQMLEHTARALEMATGRRQMPQMLIGKLIGWMARKRYVGETPFQKNGPTAPQFIVKEEPDLELTRQRVKMLLGEFYRLGETGCDDRVHGFFGRLTGAEWGITQYKHMDHHLRQFGV